MTFGDRLHFAFHALTAYPLRTGLTLLAMAVATAAVILLTALGDSARHYVVDRFAGLGTNLLIVLPGRNETRGGPPPLLGETPRDLTLDDALALLRSSAIESVAPIVVGSAPVQYGSRSRESDIIGTTSSFFEIRRLKMAQGRFLPGGDPHRGRPVVVLGKTIKQELFRDEPALGRWLRIADRRFRVIGILQSSGHALGEELDKIAVIPVSSAQVLFNTPGLFRILVQAARRDVIARARQAIETIIQTRHEGENDITVLTQDAILSAFDRILRSLTLAVAGIAAISLVVAGILIMNVMLISVAQRTPEIGLLKALGASTAKILQLFLAEALVLSILGASCGMALALSTLVILNRFWPAVELQAAPWSLPAAVVIAMGTGLLFGLLPARRAARLDPVMALHPH